MLWYCAFCGRYHTRLSSAYDFSGWRKRGKIKTKDSLCDKGLRFVALFKDAMRS